VTDTVETTIPTEEAPKVDPTEALVKSFAFVAENVVPSRATGEGNERLKAFRDAQAAKRLAAGAAAAKGLTAGKALTDNVIYKTQNEAVKVSSRAKALVAPALKASKLRPSVTVAGSDAAGWRWYVQSKPIAEK
jgi:hypothetical protein